MKAIILAAGNGSRMAPIGQTRPKLLIPILNKTILEHQVEAVTDLVDEVIVVIGPNDFGQKITDFIGSRSWPVPLSTVIQDEPLGTAHGFQAAAVQARETDRVMFLLGDDLYSAKDLQQLTGHPLAILGKKVGSDWQKWGILQIDDQGRLGNIVEKPAEFVGDIANTGASVLSPRVFELYDQLQPSVRNEYEFTDSMGLLAGEEPVSVSQVDDYWLPVGYPWHILDAQEHLLYDLVDTFDQADWPTVTKSGVVQIGDNVHIGRNVSVFNAVIGDGVTIDDDCEITNSVIGPGSKLGRQSVIEGSCLFEEVVVEPAALVYNSVLGQECLIGSGSVLGDKETSETTVYSQIKGQLINTGRERWGVCLGQGVVVEPGTYLAPGQMIGSNHINTGEVS